MWKDETLDLRLTRFFEISARAVLSLFIVAILLAALTGIGCTLFDLRLVFVTGFHGAFKAILVDMLTVLAVVEILRTALAYFTEGRVKVTYIIDTVMVTVLTEVMAFWHREMAWQQLAMVIALVLSLACIRIIAVRFSPRRVQHEL
jgi:uncharacterized membrane protein (DUF373 family)